MILERLTALQQEAVAELQEKLKRCLDIDSLEDEEVRLEIKLISPEEFDLVAVCKRCQFSEILATLPINASETWRDAIAIRSFTSRFARHFCDPSRVTRKATEVAR